VKKRNKTSEVLKRKRIRNGQGYARK